MAFRATSVSGDEVEKEAILRTDFSFIFGSPESFIENKKWRNMLLDKVFQERSFAFVTD